MKSVARSLCGCVLWCLVASLLALIVAPASGWYFDYFTVSILLDISSVVFVLIAAWGAFGAQPLIVRVAGGLALASLVVTNFSFSAAPGRSMAREDGFAILFCFWLLPLAILLILRFIPRFGWQLAGQKDRELCVKRYPLRIGDMIVTTLCFAIAIFAYQQSFPSRIPATQGKDVNFEFYLEDGLLIGTCMTAILIFLMWSALNKRNWLFYTVFGLFAGLDLLFLYNAFFAVAPHASLRSILDLVIAPLLLVVVPVCFRIAGYRVISNRIARSTPACVDNNRLSGFFGRFSSLSLPIVITVFGWSTAANLGSVFERHRLHQLGYFSYEQGQCTRATVSVDYAPEVLSSPLFRDVSDFDLPQPSYNEASDEVNKKLVQALLNHENVNQLNISGARISGPLFTELLDGKRWKSIKTSYPSGLSQTLLDRSRPERNESSQVADLYFVMKTNKDIDAMSLDIVERLIKDFHIGEFGTGWNHHPIFPYRPKYDFAEVAALFVANPDTTLQLPLAEGYVRLEKNSVMLAQMNLLSESLVKPLQMLKPHPLIAIKCRSEFELPEVPLPDELPLIDFTISEIPESPPELTEEQIAERRKLSEQIKNLARGFQSVGIIDTPCDELFGTHFLVADSLELVRCAMSPEETRAIAEYPNITKVSLDYYELSKESIESIARAAHLEEVTYSSRLNRDSLESLKEMLSSTSIKLRLRQSSD